MRSHFKNILFFMYCSMGLASFALAFSYAQAKSGITYHGRLLKPDGQPVLSSNVQFKMQIRTPGTEDCLLYEEIQNANLSITNGMFAISLGDENGVRTDSYTWNLFDTLSNRKSFDFNAVDCKGVNSYNPAKADNRTFRVFFNDGTFPDWEALPTQTINFIPMSIESYAVGGFPADSLLRFEEPDGTLVNTSPLNNSQYDELLELLAGTSGLYEKPGRLNGVTLPTIDSGESIRWDGAAWETYTPLASGSETDPTVQAFAQTALPICGASEVLKSDGTSFSCVTAASSVTGDDIQSGTIGGSTAISTAGNIQTTNDMTTGRLFLYDNAGNGPGFVGFQAPGTVSTNYTFTFPVDGGSSGQVLATNGSGVLTWISPSTGSLVEVLGTANEIDVDDTDTARPVLSLSDLAASPAGSYGSAPQVPVITVDTKGRVTSASQRYINASDLRNADGDPQFQLCNTSQVMRWSTITDKFICSPIAIDATQVTGLPSALWSESSGDVYRSTGNVGIGTDSPSQSLHIRSSATTLQGLLIENTSSDPGAAAMLDLMNDSLTHGYIFVGSSQHSIPYRDRLTIENYGGQQRGINLMASGSSAEIRFYAGGDGDSSERMRIMPDGNIGVGTTAPSANLDVNGQIRIRGGGAGNGKVLTSDADGLATWTSLPAGLWQEGSGHAFRSTGNVGIGTSSPSQKLSISGGSISLGNGYGITDQDGDDRIIIGPDNTVIQGSPYSHVHLGETIMGSPATSYGAFLNITTISREVSGVGIAVKGSLGAPGRASVHIDTDGTNNSHYPLRLTSNGGTVEVFTATAAGNVGIGTTSPQSHLDVAGTIRAQEVCDEAGANCKDISSGWGAGGDVNGPAGATDNNLVRFDGTTGKLIQDSAISVDDTGATVLTTAAATALALGPTGATSPSFLISQGSAGGGLSVATGSSGATLSPMASGAVNVLALQATGAAGRIEVRHTNGNKVEVNATGVHVSGNMGIGTTTPSTSLDVTGAITSRPHGTASGETGKIMLRELAANGTDAVTIRAPDSFSAYTLTLPATDGDSGQVLTTDGSGVLTWETPSGGGSSQWNDGASSSINFMAGNVGIGTTTPAGPLDVQGGTTPYLTPGKPITLKAQSSGGDADGGNVDIMAGNSSYSGLAGSINLSAGTDSSFGGAIRLTAGEGGNIGGDIVLTSGGGPNDPGSIYLIGGEAWSGGSINLTGGYGYGSDPGASVNLTGGHSGGEGGAVTLTGGEGGYNQPGGNLVLQGGPGNHNGHGGHILLLPGDDGGGPSPVAGNVGIGTSAPVSLLTVEGVTSLRETTAPTATANYGKIYVKASDSKLYFMNDSGTEIELGAGGGGTPGGSNGQVQFNSSGSFSGDSGMTYAGAGELSVGKSILINAELGLSSSGGRSIVAGGGSSTLEVISDEALILYSSTSDTTIYAAGDMIYDTGQDHLFQTWALDDPAMIIKQDGNIGIGTSNPTEKLDVAGKIKGTEFCIGTNCIDTWPSGSGAVSFPLTGPSDSGPVYSFTEYPDSGMGSDGGSLIFTSEAGYYQFTNAAEEQNVFIDDRYFSVGRSTGGTQQVELNVLDPNVAHLKFGTDGSGKQLSFTANRESTETRIMTLVDNGNVGIGTTSPGQKLDVQGVDSNVHVNIQNSSSTTARFPGVLVQNYSGGFGGAPSFTALASRGTNGSPAPVQNGDTLLMFNGLGATDTAWHSGTGAIIQMQAAQTFSPTALGTNILFQNAANNSTALQTRMIISQNGNVGIGTTNPDQLLHVNGPMRITASALPSSPATGDIAVDSSDSNKLKWYDGSSWQEAGGGRTSCPTGFSLVGTSGSTEAYCISTNPETATTWLGAVTNCANKTPAARLCSTSEWVHACVKAGTYGISNMTSSWQWVANLYDISAQVMGGGGCDSFDDGDVGNSFNSRCCFR